MSSATATLRSRHVSSSDRSAAESDEMTPLDSAAQLRLVRQFQLDKARQDRLWKHAMAWLYGGSAFIITCTLMCGLLFGCGDGKDRATVAAASPAHLTLTPPSRCTYFSLPSDLRSLFSSSLAAHLLQFLALACVVSWGYYSWRMDEWATVRGFNGRQAQQQTQAEKNTTGDGGASSGTTNSSPQPRTSALLMPESASDRTSLLQLQRICTIIVLLWLAVSVIVIGWHGRNITASVALLLIWPLILALLSKMAAKWSNDLEAQIQELDQARYEYHEA